MIKLSLQGSRWTFQADRMEQDIGSWTLKADQMQVLNPLLILIFIPLFEVVSTNWNLCTVFYQQIYIWQLHRQLFFDFQIIFYLITKKFTV